MCHERLFNTLHAVNVVKIHSTDFQADYITVIEDRPIMSVKYCLPVPVFYFWRKI